MILEDERQPIGMLRVRRTRLVRCGASQRDVVLYEDSYCNVAIAVSRGNAATALGVRPGDSVWIDLGYA